MDIMQECSPEACGSLTGETHVIAIDDVFGATPPPGRIRR